MADNGAGWCGTTTTELAGRRATKLIAWKGLVEVASKGKGKVDGWLPVDGATREKDDADDAYVHSCPLVGNS